MRQKQTVAAKVKKAAERSRELLDKGYTLLNPPETMYDGKLEDINTMYEKAAKACGCGAESDAMGGAEIDPKLMYYLGRRDARQGVPEVGADGKPLGTPKLGYIRYGKSDRLPLHIYRATQAQPYSATALRFNTDLVTGKGVQLVYEAVEYKNGKVEVVTMPYEHAGMWLEGKIGELKTLSPDPSPVEGEGSGYWDKMGWPDGKASETGADGYLRSKGLGPDGNASGTVVEKVEYRVAAPPPSPKPSEGVKHEELGTVDYQLKRLYEDYDAWVDTMKELEEFRKNTALDKIYQECMADDQRLDIFCMVATLSQGRRGSWDAKVQKLEYKPMTCVRLEEMDDNMRINYVYYSDRWMYDSNEVWRPRDLVAFPLLKADDMENELRAYVEANQKTKVSERQLHFAVTGQYPCGFSRYYPQPAWWSIFSSLVFQYVSTMMYDKAIAKQNATMWGKLIYINNNYLQQYFADAGATTTEQKKELRDKLVQSINDFLKRRQNNGKTCTLDSFIAPGTNTVIKSIEIVDVPQPSSSTQKEDLEELANLIFWAFGIHTSMIASFGKNPLNGGTAQREMFLLKQVMMSPRQRRFTDIVERVFRFNGWDKHLKCRIGREVLSTLDNSKTGIVEEK